MKKILFLQLPIPRFADRNKRSLSVNANLAAGYLKAAAYKNGLLKNFSIEALPQRITNAGGDSFIINNILKEGPDIFGITLSSWNTRQSLYIARKLKEKPPDLKIIAGGAEVPLDFLPPLLNESAVDIFARGYGEDVFCALLAHFKNNAPPLENIPNIFFKKKGKFLKTAFSNNYSHPDSFPSPYLKGYIKFSPYFNWLAASRGCMNRCYYCCWGGHICQKIFFFNENKIRKELIAAKENGVKEVVFIDANLNADPARLKNILKIIKSVNADKALAFQGLLRAENLTEEIAEEFRRCNFTAFDIGLQSINKTALKNIGRRADTKKWVKGVKLLKQKNITVGIDCVMLGLPGDDEAGIKESIGFLIENDLYLDSSFVPLSVFPASPLWKNIGRLGMTIQKSPPYLVLNTPDLSFWKIKEIINDIKKTARPDRIIVEPFRPGRFPYFILNSNKIRLEDKEIKNFEKPINKIILDFKKMKSKECCVKHADYVKERLARTVTVWIKNHERAKHAGIINQFLNIISKANPYVIWHIIFEVDKAYPLNYLSAVNDAVYFHPNYLDYQGIYLADDYKREYFRQSTLLYNLLNLPAEKYPGKWLCKAQKKSNIIWRIDAEPGNINELAANIGGLLDGCGIGLALSFSVSCSASKIKAFLGRIYECNIQKKEIFFTDIKWQDFWNKKIYPFETIDIPEENIVVL